jgi:hypothetical protein
MAATRQSLNQHGRLRVGVGQYRVGKSEILAVDVLQHGWKAVRAC